MDAGWTDGGGLKARVWLVTMETFELFLPGKPTAPWLSADWRDRLPIFVALRTLVYGVRINTACSRS